MNNSDRHFLDHFYQYFDHLRQSRMRLAFYGVGEKTKLLLDHIEGFNVIGLMDKNSTGQIIYGKTVLSEDEVLRQAQAVIIVANMSIAPVIYRRIQRLKTERGIDIYYINGTKPSDAKTDFMMTRASAGPELLKKEIDGHDVISFDLFDTIVMRKVLTPTDIFALVERELQDKHRRKIDFKKARIEAEYACYKNVSKYCTLDDIYVTLGALLSLDPRATADILALEIETELKFCAPRSAAVDWMKRARQMGKKVIITTDTFWTADRIARLLATCGIEDYDRIYISCEVKKLKHTGEMWPYLQRQYPGRKILHIGDNPVADIKTARDFGISAFRIESAPEMLCGSSMGSLCPSPTALDDSILLGQLATEYFNDPWTLHAEKGRLPIPSPYRLGYLCFGPLVLNYLLWLIRNATARKMDQLLFFARDGYLLSQLYPRLLKAFGLEAPPAIYFLTSRRAASIAAMEDENDIAFILRHVCKIKSLQVDQLLSRAFGVSADCDDAYAVKHCYEMPDGNLASHILERYGTRIIKNAMEERQGYLAYIASLNLADKDKLGCINFVGRGLTQLFVARILKKELSGFYFAREVDMLDFSFGAHQNTALYDEYLSPHTGTKQLATKYIYGEIIFSAPEEQLVRFDVKGKPVYEETNRERNFNPIEQCHRGIAQFMDDMIRLDRHLPEREYDLGLIDRLYGLLAGPCVSVPEDVESIFYFNDYYNPDFPDVKLSIASL